MHRAAVVSWRHELRGVRRVDLACAVALVPISIWAGSLFVAQDAQETPVQEVQVQDAQDAYRKAYDFCGGRFPYRTDMQEACRWGAYEMLPQEEGTKDA